MLLSGSWWEGEPHGFGIETWNKCLYVVSYELEAFESLYEVTAQKNVSGVKKYKKKLQGFFKKEQLSWLIAWETFWVCSNMCPGKHQSRSALVLLAFSHTAEINIHSGLGIQRWHELNSTSFYWSVHTARFLKANFKSVTVLFILYKSWFQQ